MSLIPGEEVTYLDHVSEFFLAHKGAALMLAPPDVDLVRAYEGEGVPFEVLCRGIERAFEIRRHHGRERTPTLALRACKKSIDAAVRHWRKGALRGAGPLDDPALIDRLLGEARASAGTPRGAAFRAAYRAVCAGEDVAPAAAFAYLAARSQRGLPISYPKTTGVPGPMTGGRIVRPLEASAQAAARP